MHPKHAWPMIAQRQEELAIKYDAKNFCRWSSAVARKTADHISSTWHDIECTNFLIDRAYSAICALHEDTLENDKEAVKQEQMWVHVLEMLSLSMYRDLHIICKIIEKCPAEERVVFQPLYDLESYKQLKNKVVEIRNWIVEHRENPNFYTQLASCWTSSASGTDLTITVETKKKGRKEIHLEPLRDSESMRAFLATIL